MALNPALFAALERYGLTDSHLEQLVACCAQRGSGSAKWHWDADGFLKLELTIHLPMRDVRRMQQLKELLQREG